MGMSSLDQPIVAFPRPLGLRLSRLTSYLENRATLFRWTKFIEQFIESFNHQEVQEAVLTKVGRRSLGAARKYSEKMSESTVFV